MLGGDFVINKRTILKNLFILSGICVVSFSLSNINVFYNSFIFIVPFMFFCFLFDVKWGIISFITAFFTLFDRKFIFFIYFVILLFGIVFDKCFLKPNNLKMKNSLGVYNFFVVFICGMLERYNLLFSFFSGVITYWIMIYFFDLFLCVRKKEVLNSRLSSFLVVMLGVCTFGLKLSFFYVDLSYIFLLILLFISVELGFEIGSIYTFCIVSLLYFLIGYDFELILFSYSFIVLSFVKNVSKVTRSFIYLIGVFFCLYYFKEESSLAVNYCVFALSIFFIPNRFVNELKSYCCCNEVYVEKMQEIEKRKRLKAAKKIVRFGEVFSLVNDKLDVKNRIKKNDRVLLVEEINIFNNLLREFSNEIEENKEFDDIYKLKREFYRQGVNIVDLYFKDDVLEVRVRCYKKEIRTFVVPLINKILDNQFVLESYKLDCVFGYYILHLRKKITFTFKYGVSQKCLNGIVCGDSYLVYENEDIYMFVISDGMGSGDKAKEASKLAINLLKKFLDIGFSIGQTVKSLNSVLKGKYNKEFYSTLDLFLFDKHLNKFYFCKNGAADSYLIKDNKVCFKGNSLPLGIVDNIDVFLQEIKIEKGDVIVMASDGVEDKSFIGLEVVNMNNLQKACEKIIGNEEVKDDKTVFVIKIC